MVNGDHGALIPNVQRHAKLEAKQDQENVTILLLLEMAKNVKGKRNRQLIALLIIVQVNTL